MKPHAPFALVKTATKDLVDSLLSMNTKNRFIRKRVVERYAREIEAGKWLLTNQGIGVSWDDVLVDGQHRLEAIKKCGYPALPLLIVYGLDPAASIAVDQHAKRSTGDCLLFSFDTRVSKNAPSIANVLHRTKNGWQAQASARECLEIIEKYMDEIEFVTSIPVSGGFFAAPYFAAFIHAIEFGANKDYVADFIRQVEAGEKLERDMPAFHFRNYIISTKSSGGGRDIQTERYSKALKATMAFVNGQKMHVLRA